jgi:hypothetical protein
MEGAVGGEGDWAEPTSTFSNPFPGVGDEDQSLKYTTEDGAVIFLLLYHDR